VVQYEFKAIRADVARRLLPLVGDTGWLSTPSSWCLPSAGLRIAEMPVDWVDDADSSVDVVATAMAADLEGRRPARQGALATGALPITSTASSSG